MTGSLLPAQPEVCTSPAPPTARRSDRRRQLRFPIVLDLHYAVKSGSVGEGLLVNIGSGGLLFRCPVRLPEGRPIEIALPWPFLLNGDCPLQLRIRGRIIRTDPSTVAVAIQKYEFHTLARHGEKTSLARLAG